MRFHQMHLGGLLLAQQLERYIYMENDDKAASAEVIALQ
jgi:hypothetical protein